MINNGSLLSQEKLSLVVSVIEVFGLARGNTPQFLNTRGLDTF